MLLDRVTTLIRANLNELIEGAEQNRHLKGWANYFSFGYPTGVYWGIDWFVRSRLIWHLRDAARGPLARPKERRGIRIFSGWDWSVQGARPSRVMCMPEARVFRRAGRGKSASPVSTRRE